MPCISHAQNRADSLRNLLSFAGSDTERINILNRIASFYDQVDSAELELQYLRRSLKIAKDKHLPAKQANVDRMLGNFFYSLNGYDSAKVYLKQAEDYYAKNGPEKKLLNVLYYSGMLYKNILDYSKCYDYFNRFYNLAEKVNDSLDMHQALSAIGSMYVQSGEYKIALDYFNRALKVSQRYKVWQNVVKDYNDIGSVNTTQGAYPAALEAYQDGLKVNQEHIKKDNVSAVIYANIGTIYNYMNDSARTFEYYLKAVNVFLKLDDKARVALIYGNIGNAFMDAKDYKNAEKYMLQSISLQRKFGNKLGLAVGLTNVGEFYSKTGQYEKAQHFLDTALFMEETANDIEQQVYTLSSLSQMYARMNDNKKGEEYGTKALELADKIELLREVKEISQSLSTMFEKTGQSDQALHYYKVFVNTRDTLENKESAKKLIRTELNYEYEQKQQAEKLEDEKREALNSEKAAHERTVRNLYLSAFIVVLILSVLVLRNLFRVRKANKIITEQKTEVEKQKILVDEKNRDITDSINYAKRIQQAMLPTNELWDNHFTNSFIYYKPKDIVSGDFYWMEKAPLHSVKGDAKNTKADAGDAVLIAACDCTGHGVPGAFMSMLGISSLNKIVAEQGISQPDKVLNELREEIITSLNPEGNKEEVKDGMDMTLCRLNCTTGELQYAAANNPLWVITKNGQGYELKEGEADKMPVGKYVEDRQFALYSMQVKKGDRIYIFTDGYADQFGGPKGKKFKYRHLQEVLLACQDKSMEEQRDVLERTMKDWMGSLEQVDDMLVIGIEV
jgi:serine phosphatase RsbU (regulator of sigma subunit)